MLLAQKNRLWFGPVGVKDKASRGLTTCQSELRQNVGKEEALKSSHIGWEEPRHGLAVIGNLASHKERRYL